MKLLNRSEHWCSVLSCSPFCSDAVQVLHWRSLGFTLQPIFCFRCDVFVSFFVVDGARATPPCGIIMGARDWRLVVSPVGWIRFTCFFFYIIVDIFWPFSIAPGPFPKTWSLRGNCGLPCPDVAGNPTFTGARCCGDACTWASEANVVPPAKTNPEKVGAWGLGRHMFWQFCIDWDLLVNFFCSIFLAFW